MTTRKKAPDKLKKSKSIKQSANTIEDQEICFIIMPFGEWFDYYYATIYVPAIESSGLIPRRADDLYRPSSIVHDIWALTQQAKVILADLSGKNPNVFYELGLAHAVARPAVLVTESIDDVPFDLRALRVIVYDKNEPEWGRILRDKIKTAIREVLASPLESVLPAFLKVKESTSRKSVTQTEKELISIRQDIDLVKRELQAKTGAISRPQIPALTPDIVRIVRQELEKGKPDEDIAPLLIRESGFPPSNALSLVKNIRRLLKPPEPEQTQPQ